MQRRLLLLGLGAFATRAAHALYDPKPLALIEPALGSWIGTLTYRDYQKPERMVTLSTSMTASLTAPDELALHYVFDDGPGKTVYSYERMRFDLAGQQVIWQFGISKSKLETYKITASAVQDGRSTVAFEQRQEADTDHYLFELSKRSWTLTKHEVSGGAGSDGPAARVLRSKYEFSRREA
ncbi:hypothetical protein DES44_1125 [Roseateles depolymerans]|uniref:Uncharacterized protein n=2 Tax=Roseateles depolymerans TaxID=76731 RepID=A0A0U2U6Y3_9BURK|nr:hypothetical protein [Roseateles depolymerans]ALV07793.1 hypothetical protein RD2015_3335 [Roseateles depolymerans]REG21986.1 hypothetical protein DES44_1125 [Roseateles depolymerans]